jgi:hypothetical protein
MPIPLPTLQEMARLLGGDVCGDGVKCPGPGHSGADRSLSVTPSPKADCGFVLHSFAGDDVNACKDHVRLKLGLPGFEPKAKKKRNGNGGGKPYVPYVPPTASFIYRTAEGEPHRRVDRIEPPNKKKYFLQYHWDGMWKSGAPKGENIPYRLPELLAASKSTPVYIVEGEGKCDLLAKLGFVATTSADGAGKWTSDLNEHFADRPVIILPDNDRPGHDHGQLVARNLDPVAKSVKVIELSGLPHKGDIKQWLEHDPAGAKLVKECERSAPWEPTAAKPRTKEADEALISELAALVEARLRQKKEGRRRGDRRHRGRSRQDRCRGARRGQAA